MGRSTKGDKRAIPRHRKQVAESADRQERAVEKRARQQGLAEAERDWQEYLWSERDPEAERG